MALCSQRSDLECRDLVQCIIQRRIYSGWSGNRGEHELHEGDGDVDVRDGFQVLENDVVEVIRRSVLQWVWIELERVG
jgi:hypothetical protein